MVTCKVDSQAVAIQKMNSVRTRKPSSSNSNSSGFRLLDGDHLETASSVSRNSIYKLKIDLMFDETRSAHTNRLDDPRGSHRTRSIIMFGRSELASTADESTRSITSFLQESNEAAKILTDHNTKKDVQRINNSVQAQIEQLFTDVAKDATSSFAVTYLGSLPLKDKVTSLQGLQQPLRELYLQEMLEEKRTAGYLDICATGLRVKINDKSKANNNSNIKDGSITPFHNIAVWSAVKFVISEEDGGAAFLPLITDPQNIDKASLFQPLSADERKRLASSAHAPIFAVVMRSLGTHPRLLECHGFICKSTEDAIVIAATLYQSLMAHVNSNSHRSTKRRTPRNQNGVSCISIASSSAVTGSNYLSRSHVVSSGRRSSLRSSSGSQVPGTGVPTPSRSGRKKRTSNSSLSSTSNVINEAAETTTEERKRKSHKTKRAPPVPLNGSTGKANATCDSPSGYLEKAHSICSHDSLSHNGKSSHRSQHHARQATDRIYRAPDMLSGDPGASSSNAAIRSDTNGDILTRVAIPRSGSFLNTGGLTRYKSRAARRHSGKLGGGSGGSPLGFSELFNEFRLHENLHSLDDILYAIIDADGMSFNDLKPIYKEFLLKLAVTLTKDELFQRSKNIMRRQKKKKQKRKSSSSTGSQKKSRTLLFGAKSSLKKVFQLGQFRSCRGKPPKPPRNKEMENKRKSGVPLTIGSPTNAQSFHHQQQQRNRVATSGSDVSVVRNDNAFHGLNRNSSSGYVSCSECSYDSETCTCASADRCYCSLRNDNLNKLRRKQKRNAAASKKSLSKHNEQLVYAPHSITNRNSLISCKSDDKCYCSMVEEEPQLPADDNASVNTHSDTTWCDTDSCVSASKCYCKRKERRARPLGAESEHCSSQERKSRALMRKPSDKLALDYELFTINGNGKSVQPDEALSVKKSVEAAAIFADVKLSQTTDIKSLCQASALTAKNSVSAKNITSCRSHSSTRNYTHAFKKRESFSIGRSNERNAMVSLSSSSSQKSCSADDLLSKLSAIERAVEKAASIANGSSKSRDLLSHITAKEFPNNYQSMRTVSASLEDTLGYLP